MLKTPTDDAAPEGARLRVSRRRQITKFEFEKLAWEARLPVAAKAIALAISYHMGKDRPDACPSVQRLAYMANIDERTVQRLLPKVQAALGLDITARPGRRHTFKLPRFSSVGEFDAFLSGDMWTGARYDVFTIERRHPAQPSDFEKIADDIEAMLRSVRATVAAVERADPRHSAALTSLEPNNEPNAAAAAHARDFDEGSIASGNASRKAVDARQEEPAARPRPRPSRRRQPDLLSLPAEPKPQIVPPEQLAAAYALLQNASAAVDSRPKDAMGQDDAGIAGDLYRWRALSLAPDLLRTGRSRQG